MIKQRITKIDRYREASGIKATFDSKAAYAVVGAEFDIEGYYAGTGDPAPDNVYTLEGNTDADIIQSGEDTSVYTTKNVSWLASGKNVYSGKLDIVNGVIIPENLYLEFDGSADEDWSRGNYNGFTIVVSDMNSGNYQNGVANWLKTVIATSEIGIRFGASTQATGKTIYTYHIIDNISEVTDLDTWRTYLAAHPLKIAFPADPSITIPITPVILKQLTGVNNIWIHNNGDSYIKYRV